jgi:acetate kinase
MLEIQSTTRTVRILVIPTDEELEITGIAVDCIKTLKPINKFLC